MSDRGDSRLKSFVWAPLGAPEARGPPVDGLVDVRTRDTGLSRKSYFLRHLALQRVSCHVYTWLLTQSHTAPQSVFNHEHFYHGRFAWSRGWMARAHRDSCFRRVASRKPKCEARATRDLYFLTHDPFEGSQGPEEAGAAPYCCYEMLVLFCCCYEIPVLLCYNNITVLKWR